MTDDRCLDGLDHHWVMTHERRPTALSLHDFTCRIELLNTPDTIKRLYLCDRVKKLRSGKIVVCGAQKWEQETLVRDDREIVRVKG